MRAELTIFQVELEKGVIEALQHLGKPVTDRHISGSSETYVTGKVSDLDIAFWIYPDRAAFRMGRHYRVFERLNYKALAGRGCKFLEELVKAAQEPGAEPRAGAEGGLTTG